MKKKSQALLDFIEGLHNFIISNPQFRQSTTGQTEVRIQAELRPLIIRYLENYYREAGYVDAVGKANKSFYWEGQEGQYGRDRETTFGSRNYPDFIITAPYLMAIEYKQGDSGSLVKQGIGQSIMHTLSNEFDFVYFLFHDQNKDKRIESSISKSKESLIVEKMRTDFNLFIYFV